tara:strand:- start:87 stop:332 length:246 start_codon:yes stop_codon:yes gene_type:complete
MAKTYLQLSDQITSWKDQHNDVINNIGDMAQLSPLGASNDSDLVTAILSINSSKLDSADMPVSLILFDSNGTAVKTIKGVG